MNRGVAQSGRASGRYGTRWFESDHPEHEKCAELYKMITISIPYRTGNLGAAYNAAMKNAPTEWVLLLDHDVLILRPNWYQMCVEAIENVDSFAGWISASTNRCWCDDQRVWVQGDDLSYHIDASNRLYANSGTRLQNETAPIKELGNVFSGYFILTNKTAWKRVGGFEEKDKVVSHRWVDQNGMSKIINFRCDKFLGIDNDYCLKLRENKFETFIMPGLYVYHLREKKKDFIV